MDNNLLKLRYRIPNFPVCTSAACLTGGQKSKRSESSLKNPCKFAPSVAKKAGGLQKKSKAHLCKFVPSVAKKPSEAKALLKSVAPRRIRGHPRLRQKRPPRICGMACNCFF
jgi:hypothetical protein